MKQTGSTYGRVNVSTGKRIIEVLEAGVCDALYLKGPKNIPRKNLFGRKLTSQDKSSASYTLGTAISGLRSGIVLEGNHFEHYETVQQAVRSHVPLVIISVDTDKSNDALFEGCFQFVASNHQEVIDFILISHKISEQLLIPGVVSLDEVSIASAIHNAEIPREDLIRGFLGRPEDRINAPTPAQEIIFGSKRRRVPNWFNYDNPVAGITAKDSKALNNERIANERFFYAHAQKIIDETLEEYSQLSGRRLEKVSSYKAEDAKYLFLTQGPIFNQACDVVDFLRSKKLKVGCANINLHKPFPAAELSQLLEGKSAVAVHEKFMSGTGTASNLLNEVESLFHSSKVKPTVIRAFRGRSEIANNEIVSLFELMISGTVINHFGEQNLDSSGGFSAYPKLEAHLQNVERYYSQSNEKSESQTKLKYEISEKSTFSVGINSTNTSLDKNFLENFSGLLAEHFDANVFCIKRENEYVLSASNKKVAGLADLENKLDVFITDSLLNKNLVRRLNPGAWIVFVGKSRNIPVECKEFLEKNGCEIITTFDESESHLITRCVGTLIKKYGEHFSIEISDRILDSIRDNFYSEFFSGIESLNEDQFREVFGSINIVEDINWIESIENKIDLPLAVRRYQDHGMPFTKLAQFYNYTTHFYKSGDKDKLLPEPFQAVPYVPAAASDLLSMSEMRDSLPVFMPGSCSGCGDCFTLCPHSAIPPVAIHVESLLKSAMAIATAKGQSISKFTPLVKNLAKVSNKIIGKSDDVCLVSDFLPKAFEDLMNQMNPPEEKLLDFETEFKILMDIMGSFQVAVTNPFFNNPETMEKGSGELFSLSIDPNACTGCGICEQACPENAIQMVQQTAQNVEEAVNQFRLWEQLPDTNSETITRLFHDDQYKSLAAILLSRNFYLSMVGPSSSESNQAVKTIVHLVTSITESTVQPRYANSKDEISELIDSLSANIHSKLSDAIPKGDLESFMQVFDTDKRTQIPLDDLLEEAGLEKHKQSVNAVDLQRKIELLSQLKNLYWSIIEGPTGTGRSRFGATLSHSDLFEWAAAFPSNNFCSPVIINWDEKSSEMALGLYEGNLQHQLDNLKLLRRAQLEIKDAYVANEHDEEIASLDWNMLTEKEKQLIPPLLVFADINQMQEGGESLGWIIKSDYPIKAILMNRLSGSSENLLKGFNLMVGSLLSKRASIYQISLSDEEFFTKSLLEGMEDYGPTFFHIGIDEDTLHDDNINLVSTRVFPSITAKPNSETSLLSSTLELASNPVQETDWVTTQFNYVDDNQEKALDYLITSADWLHKQPYMESHFREYNESDGIATPVADYIFLTDSEAKGKVPVITKINAEEQLNHYCVSEAVIEITRNVKMIWDSWKELSGVYQSIPEATRSKLEEEISNKYEEEIRSLKSEYDEKIKEMEVQQMNLAKKKLVDKLLYLYHKSKVN